MAQKSKLSNKFWGTPRADGEGKASIVFDKKDAPQDIQKWLQNHLYDEKGHPQRLYVQFGIENDDFDLAWLNYWKGVVCRIVADKLAGGDYDYTEEIMRVFLLPEGTEENVRYIKEIYAFADKNYVSDMLKVFFPDKDPKTGLPIKKSFSRAGSLGGAIIKERMPYIERWLAEQGIRIPKKGEYNMDGNTVQYNTNHPPFTEDET